MKSPRCWSSPGSRRTGRYDRIVVDTAPTGHTLRMLAMPETLFAVARVFDRMREKHRMIVEALRGRSVETPEDVLIADLAREARELRAILTDGESTRLSWVTLPEPMAVAETIDALERLADHAAPVERNHRQSGSRPPPAPSSCDHCSARRAFEAKALRALRRWNAYSCTHVTESPGVLTALVRDRPRLASAEFGLNAPCIDHSWSATHADLTSRPSNGQRPARAS